MDVDSGRYIYHAAHRNCAQPGHPRPRCGPLVQGIADHGRRKSRRSSGRLARARCIGRSGNGGGSARRSRRTSSIGTPPALSAKTTSSIRPAATRYRSVWRYCSRAVGCPSTVTTPAPTGAHRCRPLVAAGAPRAWSTVLSPAAGSDGCEVQHGRVAHPSQALAGVPSDCHANPVSARTGVEQFRVCDDSSSLVEPVDPLGGTVTAPPVVACPIRHRELHPHPDSRPSPRWPTRPHQPTNPWRADSCHRIPGRRFPQLDSRDQGDGCSPVTEGGRSSHLVSPAVARASDAAPAAAPDAVRTALKAAPCRRALYLQSSGRSMWSTAPG
jgi:hypothetical protein